MLVSIMDIEARNVGTSNENAILWKYYDADKYSFLKHTFYWFLFYKHCAGRFY